MTFIDSVLAGKAKESDWINSTVDNLGLTQREFNLMATSAAPLITLSVIIGARRLANKRD